MARSLTVRIIGDTRGLETALHRATAASSTFGSRATRGLAAFGKATLIAGAATAGLATVIGTKAVKAAMEEQASIAKLNRAFKNQKIAMTDASDAVEELTQSGIKLGFQDDETRAALTKLIQAGKSYSDSAKEIAVAQDLARASGQSLSEATTGLIRLQMGNLRAAKQYGIVLPDLTAKQWQAKAAAEGVTIAQAKGAWAYDQLTKKIQGQAEAFSQTAAGGIAVYRANLEQLEENLGARLLPALSSVLEWTNAHWPQISATVSAVVTGIGFAINSIAKPAIEGLIVAGQAVVGWFQENWPQISSVASNVFGALAAVVTGAVSAIEAVWQRAGPEIVAVVSATWSQVENIVRTAATVISGIVNVFAGLLHGDWARLWQGIQQITVGAISGILNSIRNLDTVGRALIVALAKAWVAAWESEIRLLLRAWTAVVTGLWGLMRAAAGEAAHAGATFGRAIYAGVQQGLGGIVGWVKDHVINPVIRAFNWLIGRVNSAIGVINAVKIPGFSWSVDTHIPGVGRVGFAFPGIDPFPGDIPRIGAIAELAAGGFVTRPTLALVGESGPEAVVPLRRGGGFGTINVYVAGNVVTENELTDAIYRGLLRKQARGALGFST